MSDWFTWLIVALLGLCAISVLRRGRGASDERGLPPELIGAELAYAERTFRSMRCSLVAKLDRAYRTRNGLVLVELKTRRQNKVFPPDVIELSVQRVALEDATGEPVSQTAWVLVNSAGRRHSHKVQLLTADEVVSLRERYVRVAENRIERPRPARLLRQCENCGHRQRCSERFGDRR